MRFAMPRLLVKLSKGDTVFSVKGDQQYRWAAPVLCLGRQDT